MLKFFCFSCLSSLILLTGCSSMPNEHSHNLAQRGEQDGLKGIRPHLQHIQNDEQKNQYLQAYQAGLSQFCQPKHILDVSLKGDNNYQNCPTEQQTVLAPIYQVGHQYFIVKKQLRDLERNQAKQGNHSSHQSSGSSYHSHSSSMSSTSGNFDQMDVQQNLADAQHNLEIAQQQVEALMQINHWN